MDRHGDIVAKRMIVEHIDAEEEHNVDQPAADGNSVRRNEERRAARVELGDVTGDRHEKELDEREERACERDVSTIARVEYHPGWLDSHRTASGFDPKVVSVSVS